MGIAVKAVEAPVNAASSVSAESFGVEVSDTPSKPAKKVLSLKDALSSRLKAAKWVELELPVPVRCQSSKDKGAAFKGKLEVGELFVWCASSVGAIPDELPAGYGTLTIATLGEAQFDEDESTGQLSIHGDAKFVSFVVSE